MINEPEKMYVACGTDHKYVQHTSVMIHSLLEHHGHIHIDLFILTSDLPEQDLKKLIQTIESHKNCTYHFLRVHGMQFESFYTQGHVSEATYYRILLPELLPRNIQKVLYLDSDVIINHSLDELWKTSIADVWVAACPENYSDTHKSALGIPIDKPCFNAGVLLVNLPYWRTHHATQQLIRIIRQKDNLLQFWDQDALNILMSNKYVLLNDSFNWRWLENSPGYLQKKNVPHIVHFVSPVKPWQYRCRHPYKYLYWKYLKNTPWKNAKPEERSIGNFFRKHGLMKWYDMWLSQFKKTNKKGI